MTHVNEDMSKILEYLCRNDQDLNGTQVKFDKMDAYQSENLLVCICVRLSTNVTIH